MLLLLPWQLPLSLLLLLLFCKAFMCMCLVRCTKRHRGAVSSMHYLTASLASFLTGSFPLKQVP